MRQEKMQSENLTKKEPKLTSIKWDLETKKEVAKIGMVASMAVVVGTSFAMKSKAMKNLHIGAGATLVGFSLWHHFLYQPVKKNISTSSLEKDMLDQNISSNALVFNEVYISMGMEGILTHAEVDAFEAKLDELLASYEKPNILLLVDVTKMESIEVGVLWHHIILGIGKRPEIQRVAIIGKNRLEKISISFTKVMFTKPLLSYFETVDEGKRWLQKSL